MKIRYWTAEADVWCTECVDEHELDAAPVYEEQAVADTPQHCAQCQEFLENRLTEDGVEYVAQALENWPGSGNPEVLEQWAEHYRTDALTQDLHACGGTGEYAEAVDFVCEHYRIVGTPDLVEYQPPDRDRHRQAHETALRDAVRELGCELRQWEDET